MIYIWLIILTIALVFAIAVGYCDLREVDEDIETLAYQLDMLKKEAEYLWYSAGDMQ